MQTISCPTCGKALPASAKYCTGCGQVAPLEEATLRLHPTRPGRPNPIWSAARRAFREDTETLLLEPDKGNSTPQSLNQEMTRMKEEDQKPVGDTGENELFEGRATWQKVVTATSRSLPALAVVKSIPGKRSRRVSPRLFFWLCLLVMLALLLAGLLGVFLVYGHEMQPFASARPVFQASPSIIALGGIVALRGKNFTPGARLALSRDRQIPLVDTGGASSIPADAQGAFSDTVIIDPAWLAGGHTLDVTDVRSHVQATFPLLVVGQNVLQGPPHLLLSSNSLDLGAGDNATNSNKLLAISNAGGGQLTWQASTGQPWLQISPQSGTIDSGGHMSVIVAVDRSKLSPGNYTAGIVFTSNTEQITLPVSMQVIPLQPAHQAVLQLSPAALTFNATANSPAPSSQVVMVSNPGIQPLTWGASLTLQNGSNWLSLGSQNGTVAPYSQQQINVGVNTSGLVPGVYKGTILFSNQGLKPIQGNRQSIYVSLTVVPLCTLTVSPGNFSFTGVHGQGAPAAQSLRIGVAQGCATSQNWSATSATVTGGNWLMLSQSSGSTPAQPQVSVNTAGLAPGTYTGTLTLVDSAGQRLVPVTLTITPVPCAITAPTTLAMQGTAGQSGVSSQNATLGSSGDCAHPLNWISTVSGGATWLSAPASGSFTPPTSATLAVQANLAGLSAGTYNGSVTVSAVDSVTNQPVGTVQIAVTLTVLPQCTLRAPSNVTPGFTASVGSNPTPATTDVTISATGNCSGNVTITPSVSASGNGWLGVTAPVTISSGGTATFTITITSNSLAAGTYSGTITLDAADGNGAISGSPQTITVSLTVQ